MRNRAPQLGSGHAIVGVGRHPVVRIGDALLGRQDRQERRERVHRKRLAGRQRHVLAAHFQPVAGAMPADHRPIRADHFDAQIVELELVVTLDHDASLPRLAEARTIASSVTLVAIAPRCAGASACLLAIRWKWQRHAPLPRPARRRRIPQLLIGFVTNFFDTLGIGSFATTTALFRLFGLVPDELIPGTLMVGHTLPVVTQALFFISAVRRGSVAADDAGCDCVAGAWIGAGVVASLSRRAVQLGMGSALSVAAAFMLIGLAGWLPAGGTASALTPRAFVVALVLNFLFGMLLTLGIGNYAPSLVLFSLLGMDPRAAFPIMMGSGAFVASIAGVRFVGAGRLHWRAALGLTLGGIPGVIVAAWLVQSLPLGVLRWLVVVVVAYASATLLNAGIRSRAAGSHVSVW